MIGRIEIARAARENDTASETIGLRAFTAREDVDLDGAMYVAEQRALRMALISEGRFGELDRLQGRPVRLGLQGGAAMPGLAAAWLDGFMAGRNAKPIDLDEPDRST